MTKSDHEQLPSSRAKKPNEQDNEPDTNENADSSTGVPHIHVSQLPNGVELQITADVPEGVRLQITLERIPTEHTEREHEPVSKVLLSTPASTPRKARIRFPQLTILSKKLFEDTKRAIYRLATTIRERLGAIPRLDRISPELVFLGISIVLYLTTRLWGIDRFPIFFYSDEANNVLFGEQVLRQDFRGSDDALLPVYFEWDYDRWAPVLPVYIHALTSALFGKSILIARATTSLLGFLGVLAVAFLLRQIFKTRLWWMSVLLLTSIPAWFLYTRTAFETVVGTALYACFLLCYMLYRYRSPQYLYAAIVLGACAFYSYSNLQAVMILIALLLFISDFRYHKQHPNVFVGSLLLIAALSLPFLRFRIQHPTAIEDHLRSIHSYWTEPSSPQEKIVQYVRHYLRGLSPFYWFLVENGEENILPNQRMPETGNLPLFMLPLMLIGIASCLRHWRSSAHRSVLIAAFVIPAGAAMDSIEIPRVLAFVVPATVLAILGLEWLSQKLNRIPHPAQATTLLLTFSLMGLGMFRESLLEGPTWNTDYGLYGTQFGVKQVFEETVPQLLEDNPDAVIIMSTTWANNTHLFPYFFLTPDQRRRV
ncbi:MAG: hypothetical protein GTO14_10490, partial [Anaerolineales bacterium]|nr:hypothetical protein [Anaerolineales bacterium]